MVFPRFRTCFAPHDLSKEIVDLDGDGLCEIVTKMPAGGYQGASTRYDIAVHKIYKAKDASLEEVSSTRLEPGLAYEDPTSPEETKKAQQMSKEALAAATMEVQFVLDHYQRAIYGRKNAGLERALAWSRLGESSHTQLLAAKALEEMDHPAAIVALDRLAKTGSRVVSGQAKGALVRLKKMPPQVVK